LLFNSSMSQVQISQLAILFHWIGFGLDLIRLLTHFSRAPLHKTKEGLIQPIEPMDWIVLHTNEKMESMVKGRIYPRALPN
jgi:hypothetical protein